MHIMEGFLPWQWCLFWFLVSMPVIVWGALRVRKMVRENPEKKLMIAVSGAFIFILSSLKLPSVSGSSSHPTGTGVGTVLFGVAITSILSTIVLLFQAVLLAHGGLTTLGANVFSMGIAGPFVAYIAYRGLKKMKVRLGITVFVTAILADFVTYVVTALQLALAFPTSGAVLPSFEAFLTIFAITQIPLAIVEGFLTVMFFDFLARSRPDVLEDVARIRGEGIGKRGRYTLAAVTVVFIIASIALVNLTGLIGTDNVGVEKISQIAPNYAPWATSLLQLDKPMEMALFAVQALIGLLIIAYVWKRYKRSKQGELGGRVETIVRDR